LRHRKISEIRYLKRLLGHCYQVLALRGIEGPLMCFIVFDDTDTYDFVNESEML
jgi:hypothetical protein